MIDWKSVIAACSSSKDVQNLINELSGIDAALAKELIDLYQKFLKSEYYDVQLKMLNDMEENVRNKQEEISESIADISQQHEEHLQAMIILNFLYAVIMYNRSQTDFTYEPPRLSDSGLGKSI